MDAHDTHCCLEHGCKYGDHECPVAKGVRKQQSPCEQCGLETEGYYGAPQRTDQEQREYLGALWEERQRPRELTEKEKKVAALASRHGRAGLRNLLAAVIRSGIDVAEMIEILDGLKHIP